MKRRSISIALLVWIATHGASSHAMEPLPAWLVEAKSLPTPAYDPKVPAVVLLNEERLSLDEKGHVLGTVRYAVRILRYEGREFAADRQHYRTDGGGVRDVRAWMVGASGDVRDYGKKDAIDAAAVGNDVYNEERIRGIDASSEADVGAVFGFEATFEEQQFSGQFIQRFQEELPVLRSRFTLEAPAGWNVTAMTFNHSELVPAIAGSTYTWEVRDLPWIEEEPSRPALTSLAPWLAVDARASIAASRPSLATFASWSGVANWLDSLTAPQALPNPAMMAKARSLAAAGSAPMDKIRPIGRYVQNLSYIAIQVGLSRGGGYRPHAASDVFARSYGDCKDKANLMKTMLACVGIESYLVPIRSDDRDFVREAWPSPAQFDHCIIAIHGEWDPSAAAIDHPQLGRLLFFDPTDPETPLGDLPAEEQGSWALLVAKEAGGLVRAPVIPTERNRMDRTIDAEVDSTGAIRGAIHERSRGREATAERRLYHESAQAAYRQAVEGWVTRGVSNATVSTILPRDDETGDGFGLDVDFAAAGYAQVMDRRLMVFRPAIVGRNEWLMFSAASRKYPIALEGWNYGETAATKLPAGFAVEELPKPVSLQTPFGSYQAGMEERDGTLRFTRSLQLKAMLVPAEQYASLRQFFESIRTAESTPVVLSRR